MNLGPTELIIIVLVLFLLFGATRLPNAARSLGRSMRIFKSEMDEMKNDKKANQGEQAITDQAQTQANDLNQQAQPNVTPQAETQNVTKPETDNK